MNRNPLLVRIERLLRYIIPSSLIPTSTTTATTTTTTTTTIITTTTATTTTATTSTTATTTSTTNTNTTSTNITNTTTRNRSNDGKLRSLQKSNDANKNLIDFSSNDYISLARNRRLASRVDELYMKYMNNVKENAPILGSTGSR